MIQGSRDYMNSSPTKSFGVVLLNFNTFSDVAESIVSFKRIDVNNVHPIIVVDSCSTDKSGLDDVKRLMRPFDELYFLNSNVGFAKGNNFGIQALKKKGYTHSYIFNPDVDFSNLNFNEIYDSALMHEASIVDSVVNGTRQIFRRGSVFSTIYSSNKTESFEEGLLESYRFNGCAFLVNNRDFFSVGGFDESTFLYCEELIFSEKCYQAGLVILNDNNFRVKHYFGGSVLKYFRFRKYKHMYLGLYIYLTKYRDVGQSSSKVIAFLSVLRQACVNFIKRNL